MKKLIIIPILLLVIMSCSKSDNNGVLDFTNSNPELIGKWKYVEYLNDMATEPNMNIISDGYTIIFNEDGTFLSNEMIGFPNGNYIVSSTNLITLNYVSNTGNTFIKIKNIKEINNNTLKLFEPSNDFTSSGEKFEKVSNQ